MAARFWVGGTGNWNDTAKWAAITGGATGASVPVAADTVTFDSNSDVGGANFTVTIPAGYSAACTSITVATSMTAIVTINFSGLTAFLNAGLLSVSGNTAAAGILFGGGSDTSCAITGSIAHNSGTFGFVLGGTITTTNYQAPNSTIARNLQMNGGTIKLTGIGTSTIWSVVPGTGGFNIVNTGTVECSGALASATTRTITHTGTNPGNVSFLISGGLSGSITTFTAGTVGSLDFTGYTGSWTTTASLTITGSLTLYATMSVTGTSNLTFAGTGIINTFGKTLANSIFIASTSTGLGAALTTSSSFTLTSGQLALGTYTLTCDTFVSNNSNSRTIDFGSGKVVTTSTGTTTVWNTSNITGLTVSGTPLVEITGAGTASRTVNAGALSEANSISFSVLLSAAATVNFTTNTTVRDLIVNMAGTLTNSALTIYGGVTTTAGTLTAGANAWIFAATSGTDTLISNGKTWDFPIVFNGAGGTWQLGSALTMGTTRTVTLTAGTLSLVSYTLTTNTFNSSNTNTRSINFGTGKIAIPATLIATDRSAVDMSTITGFTPVGTGGFELVVAVNATSQQATHVFSFGTTAGASETTAPNFKMSGATSGGESVNINLLGAVRDIEFSVGAAPSGISIDSNTPGALARIYGNLIGSIVSGFAGFSSSTIPLVFAGTTGTQTINVSSGITVSVPITFSGTGTYSLAQNFVVGTSGAITFTSGTLDLNNFTLTTGGAFSSSNTNARTIAFGTGKIVLAGAWSTSTATNLTVTGTPLVETTGISINAGAGAAHTEANSISFSLLTTATRTVTITTGSQVRNLIVNLTTGTLANTAITIYGGVTTTAGTLTAGTNTWTFASTSGPNYLNSNGKTWDWPVIFNGIGGTWQLSAALTVGAAHLTTLTAGTLDLNNSVLSTGTFASSNSNVRTIAFGTSGRIDFSSTTATSTLLTLTTTTNLTIAGTPAMGVVGNGTQARVITNGAATSEATGWNFRVNTTSGTTDLPAFTKTLTLVSGTVIKTTDGDQTLWGGLIYTAGTFTLNASFGITFAATSGTWPLSFNSLSEDLTFSGVGGTWQLTSNCSIAAANTTILTNGTLDLNNFALATGTFASTNSNVRTIAFGTTGRIDFNSTTVTTTLLDLTTTTNLTLTGTPAIGTVGAGTQSRVITNGAATSEATAWDFRVNTTGGTTSVPTYTRTLTQVAGAVANATLSIYGGYIWTAGTVTSAAVNFIATSGTWPLTFTGLTESLTFNGAGGTWQQTQACSVSGSYTVTLTAGTLDLNGFDLSLISDTSFSSSGTGVRSIILGTKNINITPNIIVDSTKWNTSTDTNLTVSGTGAIVYSSNGNGLNDNTQTLAFGSSVLFNVTVGTVAATGGFYNYVGITGTINNLTASTVGGASNPIRTSFSVAGNVTFIGAGIVSTSTVTLTFTGTATQTFASNVGTGNITIDKASGSVLLGSAITMTTSRILTLTSGTLNLNGFNITLTNGKFISSNTNTRSVVLGTNNININSISSNSATIWDTSIDTNLTTSGTGAIVYTSPDGNGTSDFTMTMAFGSNPLFNVSIGNVNAGNFYNYIGFSGVINNLTTSYTWPGSATPIRSNVSVGGNVTYSTATHFQNFTLTFTGSTATQTLISNVTLYSFAVNKASGSVLLGNAITSVNNAYGVTVSSGTLDLNTYLLTVGFVTMTGGTIAFGTSKIVANATIGAPVNITGGATGTGTPLIEVTGASASGQNRIITCTAPFLVNITAGAAGCTIALTTQVHSVTFSGAFAGTLSNTAVGVSGNLTLLAGMVLTAGANAMTFNGTSGTQVITPAALTFDFPVTVNTTGSTVQLAAALTMGATRRLTLTAGTLNLNNFALSTGLFASANTNARTLAFGTTGSITLSSATASTVIWDTSTATNLTVTGTSSVTAANAAGNKVIDTGTMAEANAINFTILTPATVTIGLAAASTFRNLTMNNASLVVSLSSNTTVFGNFTVTALSSWSGAGKTITFDATSGTQTVTSAGKTINSAMDIAGGSTVTLADALTTSAAVTLTSGGFNAVTYSVTVNSLSSSNTNTRSLLLGTGIWTLSGTGSVWDLGTTTGLTFTKSTANIVLSDVSATARTFAGGGLTYNNLTIGGATGVSTTTITGSNTFTTLASTKTTAHTIVFTAGTTTTFTDFIISGTSGNIVTLASDTPGSTYTLTKTAATAFQINFMSISDATATPSSTWYASRSTDGGNNTGIIFQARPLYWRGGTGTWDASTTTNWSFTSGGASAGVAPVSDCNVFFDSNSDVSAVFTVTISTGATCRDMLVTTLDFTMTLAGTAAWSVTGSLTWITNPFLMQYSGAITFTSSLANTITLAANSLSGSVTFNGTGSWTLGSAFQTSGSVTTTLTAGTLNLSSYTLTTGLFSSNNSNTRSINFGTGKIVVGSTASSNTVWNTSTITGLTIAGNPLVEITGSATSITRTINTGALSEANSISFSLLTSGASVNTFTAGNTVRDLIINMGSGTLSNTTLTIYGNVTTSVGTLTAGANAWTFASTSGTDTLISNGKTWDWPVTFDGVGGTWQLGGALTLGSTRTLTVTNGTFNAVTYNVTTGYFNTLNSNVRTVTMGSGTWTLTAADVYTTSVTDASLNSYAITTTGAVYSDSSPVRTGGSMLFNGSAFMTVPSNTGTVYGTGDFTMECFVCLTANPGVGGYAEMIDHRGTSTSAAGVIAYYNNGGTYQLQFFTGTTQLLSYIVDLGNSQWNHIVVVRSGTTLSMFLNGTRVATATNSTSFSSQNSTYIGSDIVGTGRLYGFLSNVRCVKGSAVYNPSLTTLTVPTSPLTAVTGTTFLINQSVSTTTPVWNAGLSTNLTLNPGSSTITLSDTTDSVRTFAGGGLTYNNLTVGGSTGRSSTRITGPNTFNTFASARPVAHTITFPSDLTTTFTSFTATGTSGNILTIKASSTTQATLSKPTVWYVGANSTNGGGNTNLIYSGGNNLNHLNLSNINGDPPVPASSGFFMFCT